MTLIERLKAFETADYRYYGWGLMVFGKVADLGSTWYALVTIPAFIERGLITQAPVPAIAYQQYGILGLVLLNGLAIMAITLVVEAGTEYMRRKQATPKQRQIVILGGYWLPGMFWLFIAYSNAKAVHQARALFGF